MDLKILKEILNKEIDYNYELTEDDFETISESKKIFELSLNFFEENKDKINWILLPKIPEYELERLKNCVDWETISLWQEFWEERALKWKDRLNWYYVYSSNYGRFSRQFIKETSHLYLRDLKRMKKLPENWQLETYLDKGSNSFSLKGSIGHHSCETDVSIEVELHISNMKDIGFQKVYDEVTRALASAHIIDSLDAITTFNIKYNSYEAGLFKNRLKLKVTPLYNSYHNSYIPLQRIMNDNSERNVRVHVTKADLKDRYDEFAQAFKELYDYDLPKENTLTKCFKEKENANKGNHSK